jgi:O-antigen/teichoic acid export membrane protein
MLSGKTILTIVTKLIILLANFALVVFSTQLWGSEGRGEIALVIANISIILIISNIFCGVTIAFNTPRLNRDLMMTVALAGSIIVSLTGAVIFSALFGFRYFNELFLITLLMSLTTAITTYWLGRNNIRLYNFMSLAAPILILGTLTLLYFHLDKTTLNTYFLAYYTGYGVVLIFGIISLAREIPFRIPEFSLASVRSIFNYGLNNEFNGLLLFLNYRLSYYFILKTLGLAQLGVFSVAVSISEAVWIISRSMSAIHFSNVINSEDQFKNRSETIVFVRQSFWISLLLLSISIVIPKSLYQYIFGNEFGEIKTFIILMIPGILAVAVSNIYDHYFSGIGNLKLLRNRSFIGLGATLILLPLLIGRFHLTGVCITMNISCLISLGYLWFNFRNEGKSNLLNTLIK